MHTGRFTTQHPVMQQVDRDPHMTQQVREAIRAMAEAPPVGTEENPYILYLSAWQVREIEEQTGEDVQTYAQRTLSQWGHIRVETVS